MPELWEDGPTKKDEMPSINVISVDDLKSAIAASTGTAHMDIELCYCGKQAKIRPLKTEDKKELLKAMESKTESLINKCFDDIIEKYVEFPPGVNLHNIVTAERNQILAYIRIANGDKFADIMHPCPECEHNETNIKYDLNDIYLKPFDKELDNVVEFNLDNGQKCSLLIGPLTRVDEKAIERYIGEEGDTLANKQFAIMSASIQKAKLIDSSGQERLVEFKTLEDKCNLYKVFTGGVEQDILKIVKNYGESGLKMPFEFKCSKCGYQNREDAHIAVFFIS